MSRRNPFIELEDRFVDEALDILGRAVTDGWTYVPGLGVPESFLIGKGYCTLKREPSHRKRLYPTDKAKTLVSEALRQYARKPAS